MILVNNNDAMLMTAQDLHLTLKTRNRGDLKVTLHCVEAKVQKIEAATNKAGKKIRLIHYRTSSGDQQIRLNNPTITIFEGQQIRLVFYQAAGFLQKMAGFHNLDKKGSYLLHQPKDWFTKWLHVRPAMPIVAALVLLPLFLGVVVMYLHLVAGVIALLLAGLGAAGVYFKLSKKFVLVSDVHLKSVLLQLMDGFKQLAREEDPEVVEA